MLKLLETGKYIAWADTASAKPFIVIAHPSHVEDVMCEIRGRLLERGVATFTSFGAAARATDRAITYWRFREGLE